VIVVDHVNNRRIPQRRLSLSLTAGPLDKKLKPETIIEMNRKVAAIMSTPEPQTKGKCGP
jgi:hypothetical protein